MRFEACFLGLIAASGVAAIRRCGTPMPTPAQVQMARKFRAQELAIERNTTSAINLTAIEVVTYFHVIAANRTKEGGYLDPIDVDRQLAVLNQAYKPHKISFKSGSMQRWIMPEWAENCKEEEMKKSLRRGTYADLNVYFHPKMSCIDGAEMEDDSYLGYSAGLGLPTYASSTETLLSGVHVRADTVPGSNLSHYNQGATVVHEVGHWLGLFHPFEGGCHGDGDFVTDTPPVSGPFVECLIPLDSCRGGGMDLMDNYMAYYWDDCMASFTQGQEARMFSSWSLFREPYKLKA